jgi:hypothetical protein
MVPAPFVLGRSSLGAFTIIDNRSTIDPDNDPRSDPAMSFFQCGTVVESGSVLNIAAAIECDCVFVLLGVQDAVEQITGA